MDDSRTALSAAYSTPSESVENTSVGPAGPSYLREAAPGFLSTPTQPSSNSIVNNSHNIVQNFITQKFDLLYGDVTNTEENTPKCQLRFPQTHQSASDPCVYRAEDLMRMRRVGAVALSRILPSIPEDGNPAGACVPEPHQFYPPCTSNTDSPACSKSTPGVSEGPKDYLTSRSSFRESSSHSLMSGSTLSLSKIHLVRTRAREVKLPDTVHKDIRSYMLSNMKSLGPASEFAIRLWDPYRNINLDEHLQKTHCTIGDVGKFRSDGGFDVKFNIFMTKEKNMEMKYNPPTHFQPFSTTDYEERRPALTVDHYITNDFQRKHKERGKQAYTFESISKPKYPGGVMLVLPQGCEKRQIQEGHFADIGAYFNDCDFWDDPRLNEDLLNGSLMLISASYRSTTWGGATLRKSKFESSQGPHEAQLKRPDNEIKNVYEWETHRAIQATKSPNEEIGDLTCTVAVEVYSFRYKETHLSQYFSSALSSRASLSSTSRTSIRSLFSVRNRR